jgi:hypothetical protein
VAPILRGGHPSPRKLPFGHPHQRVPPARKHESNSQTPCQAEGRFGPPVETKYSRQLRRLIQAGPRRAAAARNETHVLWRPSVAIPGLTLGGAMFRG